MSSTDIKQLDPLHFALNQNALIEASAGTGKTFTIAFLYVRLVLGHGQPENSLLANGLLPRDILVVTFTDAATKELIDRIRANLSLAAEVFAEQPRIRRGQDVGLLATLKASYPAQQHSACRKKLLDALELMDEAAISTIHSWCNRMLSEHAFDSGSLFELTLESDQKPIIQQACEDYWRTHVYSLNAQEYATFIEVFSSPDDLHKKIAASLASSASLKAPRPLFELTANIKKLQGFVNAKDWGPLVEQARDFLQASGKKGIGPIENALNELFEWLPNGERVAATPFPDNFGKWTGYKHLSSEGFKKFMADDGQTLAISELIDSLLKLKQLKKENTKKQSKIDISEHANAHIAEHVIKEQDLAAQLGFNELLVKLNHALNASDGESKVNHALASTIAKQFPVALIDEFQDTDPVQFGIFEKVYLQNEPAANDAKLNDGITASLIMIGDPKQAIYSFRGGDIYTYLDASKKVNNNKYTLATNYRSTNSMVEAVNHLFARAEQLPQKAFQFVEKNQADAEVKSLIPFNPVKSNGLKDKLVLANNDSSALLFWHATTGDDDNSQGQSQQAKVQTQSQKRPAQYRETLATGCAEQIAQILNDAAKGKAFFEVQESGAKRPVMPNDIAILVNNKREAAAIQKALLQKNLNSVYLSTKGSVLSAPEAKDILLWLKAIAEPSHVPSLRNAVATVTLGKSLSELHQAISDESYLDALILQFQGYQHLWKTQGVLPMMRRLMMDYGVQRTLLSQKDGERTLTDILHIGELLQQASAKIDGMANLISYYENLINDENKEESDFNMPRLESDSDLIKVVTVHKSKGLQYPLVFLPYATQQAELMRGTIFVSYHDEQGNVVSSFDVDKTKKFKLQELKKEEIRKLYVALTRAKYATWVGAADVKGWHESGLAYLLGVNTEDDDLAHALGQLVQDKSDCIGIIELPEPSDIVYTPPSQEALGQAREAMRVVMQSWRSYSYSSIEYHAQPSHANLTQAASKNAKAYEDSKLDEKVINQLSENQEDGAPDAATSLAIGALATEQSDPALAEKSIHNFYRGAKPGTFLHDILEWAAKVGFKQIKTEPDLLKEHVQTQCEKAGWSEYSDIINQWMSDIIATPFPVSREASPSGVSISAALSDLDTLIPEMEFWFSTDKARLSAIDQAVVNATFSCAPRPAAKAETMSGIFKGFIDLTFEHEGKYYVLDYKSNYLGENEEAYTADNIEEAIMHHRYDLQFVIYLVALHRLLKNRIADYSYDKHVGGCVYYFLRGLNAPSQGVFTTKPPLALIEGVDEMFNGGYGDEPDLSNSEQTLHGTHGDNK